MASLDTRTGRYPENDHRPPNIGERVYRHIQARNGSSLYWDQPALLAAYALSRLTEEPRYGDAADDYVNDFLALCVARNGVWLWGNHYFYNVALATPVCFHSDAPPVPCSMDRELGDHHEIRPISPVWDVFWRISRSHTEKSIRTALQGHLIDPQTGEFQVHAVGVPGNALLETGGIWVETLSWLYARTGDEDMISAARKIAEFSFRHRNSETGLIENHPTKTRWDKYTSTTEAGLWAGCLLRAGGHVDSDEWIPMAKTAMDAWLRYGWDPVTNRYFGKLDIASGQPVRGPRESPLQPGEFSNVWEPMFPSHDYPMPFAEACLRLYQITGATTYKTACERWVEVIDRSLPARDGAGGYAENYGRVIHFLFACARSWKDSSVYDLALRVADEGLRVLFDHGMFRGHPGEHRYDAVDGVGYFMLALLALYSKDEPDMGGSGW